MVEDTTNIPGSNASKRKRAIEGAFLNLWLHYTDPNSLLLLDIAHLAILRATYIELSYKLEYI